MAKIGDHVDTTHGVGTVISGKRVFIHGTKDKIISYAGDKERDKKKRVIRGVVKTRFQVEEDSTYNHKQLLKKIKSEEKGVKVEQKEVKKEVKKKESKPRKKLDRALVDDFENDLF